DRTSEEVKKIVETLNAGNANQLQKEEVVPKEPITYVLDGSGAIVSVENVSQSEIGASKAENAASYKNVLDEQGENNDENSVNDKGLAGRQGDKNVAVDDGEEHVSSVLPDRKLIEVELCKGGVSSVIETEEEEEDVKPLKKKRKMIVQEDDDLEDVKPAIRRGRLPRSSKPVAEVVEVLNIDEGRMSVMPTGKKFQLTANDVHYVFQIPIGPLPVPISNAHADSELKNTWKDLYGGAKHEVTVPQLVEVMTSNEGMRMGNDEFKKCFVMYSMITLLAPTSNRKADFKLVLALENVHLFQDYNWCQYVLDDLAEKLSSYSANQKYVPGCLLLLQICYFHRLRSRGNVLPSTLPLIQHLSDKDFRSRLADEDKVYGMADLDKVTYPVTKISNNNSKVLAIEAKKTEEKIDEMKFLENKKSAVEDNSVNDFPRVVTFNLPAGIESNEEIHMLAKNMPIPPILGQNKNIFTEISAQPVPDIDMSLGADPNLVVNYLLKLGEPNAEGCSEKQPESVAVADVFGKSASQKPVGMVSSKKQDVEKTAKKGTKEMLLCFSKLKVLHSDCLSDGEESSTDNKCSTSSEDHLICDIDCGAVGDYSLQLISRFLRVYNPKAKRMKSLRLQVADYCFGDNYEGFDMIIMTLIEEELISSRVMDCFFVLLNYVQCQKAATVAKLYFGGEHMLPLLRCIFNGEGCFFEKESFGAWDQWLDVVKTIAFFDAKLPANRLRYRAEICASLVLVI
uniref:Uncharacterized protein n=1 Tax=Chenopodium quinoa TaxID=63459 RepID=A0A803KV89_CHEQI